MFSILPLKGSIENIDGFFCDGVSAGLKSKNKLDLGFIYSDTPCLVEAIFTRNTFQAAPLKHFQKYPKDFKTNFILINSKNANALSGQKGIDDIDYILSNLSKKFALQNPCMSSTGIIAKPLEKDKILSAAKNFDLSQKNAKNLSGAILTTDSFAKISSYEVILKDKTSFKICACAKGAGMINPCLATMLCFIVTDANIPKQDMKEALDFGAKTTFNAISVDGDTSTNDSILLLSNQKSKAYEKQAFKEALRLLMQDLSLMIIKDAEGGKKVVSFEIKEAKDFEQAQKVAKDLANSLLVKTALFGEDPNFGRIASTIGASGVACDETKLSISYNDIFVYKKGEILLDDELELVLAKIMKKDSYKITCYLGMGEAFFTSFACDLGYDYVKINADYRT